MVISMIRSCGHTIYFSVMVYLGAITSATNAFAELPVNNEYTETDISIPSDGTVADLCIAEYSGAVDSQLRCLIDAGFLYAHLDLSDENKIQSIVTGPQVRLASLRPVEDVKYLSPQLLMSMAGMELGQPITISSFQRLAIDCKLRNFLKM